MFLFLAELITTFSFLCCGYTLITSFVVPSFKTKNESFLSSEYVQAITVPEKASYLSDCSHETRRSKNLSLSDKYSCFSMGTISYPADKCRVVFVLY